MGLLNVSTLSQCLPGLQKEEFDLLVRAVLKMRGYDLVDVPLERQVQLALCEWLNHLGLVTDAQRRYVLALTEHFVVRYCERLKTRLSAEGLDKVGMPSTWRLCIADERYVTTSNGDDTWADLHYEESGIQELPAAPVTVISCDLSALYCRLYDRLVALGRRKDAATATVNSGVEDGPGVEPGSGPA